VRRGSVHSSIVTDANAVLHPFLVAALPRWVKVSVCDQSSCTTVTWLSALYVIVYVPTELPAVSSLLLAS
jgi:hypothetical protein